MFDHMPRESVLLISQLSNPFSPFCLLLCFLFSGLLHPLHYWTQSILQCIPPLSMLAKFTHASIAGCISISKSFVMFVTIPVLEWKGYNVCGKTLGSCILRNSGTSKFLLYQYFITGGYCSLKNFRLELFRC